jgi:metallo-beta-lactamase class B
MGCCSNRGASALVRRVSAGLVLGAWLGIQAVAADPSPGGSPPIEVQGNAALPREWVAWNVPRKPFRLIGPIHYVGPAGISSFLITTPAGHILLDTGFPSTPPIIRENMARLGFRLADIRMLLSSHAHVDHVGGHALLKQWTGARIVMSEADAALLASGGTNDYSGQPPALMGYPPARADEIIADGGKVSLGGVTLTCHLTPGHTRGCTSWTMEVEDSGRPRQVLFFGSTTVLPGVSLVGNARYPGIAEDFKRTYATLRALPCDVFLAPHAGFFDLAARAERLERDPGSNPFIDPAFARTFLESAERQFKERLARERSAAGK